MNLFFIFFVLFFVDDVEAVSQSLVRVAKEKGSTDNISVIVVFLREPSKVADRAGRVIMDTLDNATPTTNPFANNANNTVDLLTQKVRTCLT